MQEVKKNLQVHFLHGAATCCLPLIATVAVAAWLSAVSPPPVAAGCAAWLSAASPPQAVLGVAASRLTAAAGFFHSPRRWLLWTKIQKLIYIQIF